MDHSATERLYYRDARCLSFQARVVETADAGRRVYLDRSAFYPTSGGQPHDTGTLAGAAVVDVRDEDGRIAHVLGHAIPLTPGDVVRGEVDAGRRNDHMQQHSGQHLLSAVFAELHGAPTVSVHFGPESSLVELDTPALDREQLVAAETRANEIVREGRPVTVAFEDAGQAVGLRKPSGRAGELRIVTIAGLDRSACGGTHVASTAEIGAILLGRTERIRQRLRVEFLCGERAVRRARGDHERLAEVAQILSAAPADVAARVAAMATRVRELEAERRTLLAGLAAVRARELHGAATPDASGTRLVVERTSAAVTDLHRETAQHAAALPQCVYVVVAAAPATVLVAASADSGYDAGALLREAVGVVGGRGGGSPRVAQGSVPDAASGEVVAECLAGRFGRR